MEIQTTGSPDRRYDRVRDQRSSRESKTKTLVYRELFHSVADASRTDDTVTLLQFLLN